MLTEQRHQLILAELEVKDKVQLQELMDLLDVSESTIRRDLSTLERQGKLLRVHGGAKRLVGYDQEFSFQEKVDRFGDEKIAIGQLAATFVEERDIIYLDAGTTTLAMIPYLNPLHQLTVVTNGIAQAEALLEMGIEPIVLGGQLRLTTQAIVGSTANQQVAAYRFHKAFLGINGIHPEAGLTTTNLDEGALKRNVIDQSRQTYVLADPSKFEKINFSQVGKLDEVTLLTVNLSRTQVRMYEEYTRIEGVQ